MKLVCSEQETEGCQFDEVLVFIGEDRLANASQTQSLLDAIAG